MRTLYLRNVPDHVVADLERLASRAGMSLSAFSVQALGEISRRANNAALLDALPSLDIEVNAIVETLDASRSDR